MRLRGLLVNLAVAAASVLFVLAGLELLARWHRHATGGGKEQLETVDYTEHDPVLGWHKVPGARVTYRRREYTVDVAINSLGLRDPERGYAAPPGTFRILALGDSFVEGYTVALESTLTQVLERELSGGACPVQVINGGSAAYSTDQEYLFYVHEGARYDPRLVLLFAFYNDLLANTRRRHFGAPKPRLRLEDGRLVLENDPVPEPPPPPPRPQTAPEPEPIHGSAAWRWLQERLMVGAPRAFDALARLGLWEPLGGDVLDEQLYVYKRRRRPEVEAAWTATDRILRGLERAVSERGGRLVVVYVPNRMEVSDRDWELTRLRFELNDAWDRRIVAERFGEIAASAGIAFLDLTEALRAADHGVLGGPYFVYDGHWNAAGHRAAAEAIAGFLRETDALPACVSAAPAR